MTLKIRRTTHLVALLIWIAVCSLLLGQTPAKQPVAHFTATTTNVSGAGELIKIDLFRWSTEAERDQLISAWTLTGEYAPPPVQPATAAGARGARGARAGRGAEAAPDGAEPAAEAPRGGRGGDAPAAGRGTRGGRGQGGPPAAADQPPDDGVRGGRGGAAAGAAGRGGGRGDAAAGAGAAPAPEPPRVTPEGVLAKALKKAPTVGLLWTGEDFGYTIRYAYRSPSPDGTERVLFATDRRIGQWNNRWKPLSPATTPDYEFTLIEVRLNTRGEGEGKSSLTTKVAVDQAAKTIALDGYPATAVVLKNIKKQ